MSKWKRDKSLQKRWDKKHLLEKYGDKCYICNEPFKNMKDITIDHIIPTSKGGMDILDNYRMTHLQCNQLKNNYTLDQLADLDLLFDRKLKI